MTHRAALLNHFGQVFLCAGDGGTFVRLGAFCPLPSGSFRNVRILVTLPWVYQQALILPQSSLGKGKMVTPQ